jgi:stress response protein YsnF
MSYTGQTTSDFGSSTITAFFDSRSEADRAVERLAGAGIPRASVRMVADGNAATVATASPEEDKGFWASLADLFMPDEDRSVYAEGLRRGGFLVTVSGLASNLYDTALDILDDEGSIDIDERSRSWESEGWSRSASHESYATSAYGKASGSGASSTLEADGEEVIPVVQEELRVGKRDVNNGRVRVRSYVTETPISESVSLREENVDVSRRVVDRPVTGAEDAFVDRVIEAEEHREEAVVSKDARVVEEISLKKTAEQHQETVSDSVRKTEVEVDDQRTGGVSKSGTSGFRRD